MTARLAVPTDSDGLRELLSDGAKLKEFFSQAAVANGDTKAFLDAYAKHYVKSNPDSQDDLRTQVQSVMFDMIRESGGGGKPRLELGDNGRPRFSLSQDSSIALARGKGAAYNKASDGAQFEEKVGRGDRLESLGEYCAAIRYKHTAMQGPRRDELIRKLDMVSAFQNSFSENDPGAGGFLVPEEMRSELLMLSIEQSITRQGATVIPMSTLRVPIPIVDDTSHVSSLFGGVTFYWAEESAPITESQARFGRAALEARKLTGYFKVPNELLQDAPAFSGFFNTAIPKGLAWYEDTAFMTGDGAEKPLGYIGTQNGAYVQVDRTTVNQVQWADIVTMFSRMLPTSLKNACWIANIDVFPQLAQMTTGGAGNPGIWLGGWASRDATSAPPMSIMGLPLYFTEKVPSLNTGGGTTGDISLVDLSYYLIGDRQAIEVAASEHVAFQNNQTAYRIIERVDGRPWLITPLTPHSGSANTLSPFVGLSATHT